MNKKSRIGSIIAVFIVAAIFFSAIYGGWNTAASAFTPITITHNVILTIQSGEDSAGLADDLYARGLIKNKLAFRIWAKLQGLDAKLQIGSYQLKPGMSMDDVVAKLESGKPDGSRLTIEEGLRLEQIAASINALKLQNFKQNDFLKYAKNPSTFPDASKYPFLKDAQTMEGMLFPDTYLVNVDADARQILDQMLDEFNQVMQTNNLAALGQPHNLSMYQVVILASIVQREVNKVSDMPLVAGIYWNRAETDNDETVHELSADPTVEYARDTDNPPTDGKYWVPLGNSGTGTSVDPDSLWNTYTHAGWPPTPISSPGLDALKAAASPKQTSCYFFLTRPKDNVLMCTNTYAEFQQISAQYLGG